MSDQKEVCVLSEAAKKLRKEFLKKHIKLMTMHLEAALKGACTQEELDEMDALDDEVCRLRQIISKYDNTPFN